MLETIAIVVGFSLVVLALCFVLYKAFTKPDDPNKPPGWTGGGGTC